MEPLEESSWRPRRGECQLIIHLQHHLLESLSFLRSTFSKDFCDCPATTVGQSAIHDFCLLRTCRPSTHDPSAVSLLIHIVVISFRALSHCSWKTNSNFYGHYSYTCGSLISSDKNVSRNFTKEKLRGLLCRSGNTFDLLWTAFISATFLIFASFP